MSTHAGETFTDHHADWAAEATLADGLIRNVALCGNSSKNGYSIPSSAFGTEAHVRILYENKPVFIDHPNPGRELNRSVRDLAGKVENVRFREGRPWGDIRVLDTESGRSLKALAEAKPPECGMSHVAKYAFNEQRTIVTAVEDVLSVDVVVFPATTRSFTEQKEDQMAGESDNKLVANLEQQLKDVRASEAEWRSKHDALATANTTLKAQVESLTAEKGTLTTERDALKGKVDGFEAQQALAARRTNIVERIKHHKLNPDDKVQVSEAFMGTLVGEPDETKREALITDRAKLITEAASGKVTPAPVSTERTDNPSTFDPAKAWDSVAA